MANKKIIIVGFISIILAVPLTLAGVFYWKNLRGIGPVIWGPVGGYC